MFIVYGRDNCKYCTKAKELLTELDLDFKYIDVVASQADNLFMQKHVIRTTGEMARTVPQIFKVTTISGGSIHIGGYDNLREILLHDGYIKADEVKDTDSFQMDL